MNRRNQYYIPFQDLNQQNNASFLIRPVLEKIVATELGEKPHRHNYQEIIWIKSGQGKHTIDAQLFHLQPNTFYLIGQGQVHHFLEGSRIEGYLLRFTNNFLPGADLSSPTAFNRSLLNRLIEINEVKLDPFEIPSFEIILEQLAAEYNTPSSTFGKRPIIQHLLLALLIKLERKIRTESLSKIQGESNYQKQIYQSFLLLLEDNFHRKHQIDFYANELGISKRKLTKITQTHSGKASKHLLISRLITESKRLLAYTNCSLKEITYRYGY
jgi:AraC family transcriptional activator of pobA